MLNEFGPGIEGQRLHLVRHRRKEADDRRLDRFHRFRCDRGTEGEQGFPFHHSHQRIRAISSHECVAFPVPDPPLLATRGRRASIGVR